MARRGSQKVHSWVWEGEEKKKFAGVAKFC
jgi:hypothetical protein